MESGEVFLSLTA